jgi:hypothetical protein
VGEDFYSFIAPSFKGALLVRLVIEGTMIIIVPLIASFLSNMATLLAPVFLSSSVHLYYE